MQGGDTSIKFRIGDKSLGDSRFLLGLLLAVAPPRALNSTMIGFPAEQRRQRLANARLDSWRRQGGSVRRSLPRPKTLCV